MFYRCSSLISIDISSFNTKKVKIMDKMFYRCSSLISLNLSHFNTQSISSMKSMFNGCSSLTSIDLSNAIIGTKNKFNSLFYGCSNLTYIDISSFSFSSTFNLFDSNIPSEGTIKVKNETIETAIKNQIPNWKFLYKSIS